MLIEILLLILALAVSLYDLRKGKVPNWVTLPILTVGLIAHFPGSLDVWLLSLMLYTAWRSHWLAAGDAKLWLALLWAFPVGSPAIHPLVFFATFLVTGLLQISLRKLKRQPLTGIRSPGAWRTIPFILWSLYVH